MYRQDFDNVDIVLFLLKKAQTCQFWKKKSIRVKFENFSDLSVDSLSNPSSVKDGVQKHP